MVNLVHRKTCKQGKKDMSNQARNNGETKISLSGSVVFFTLSSDTNYDKLKSQLEKADALAHAHGVAVPRGGFSSYLPEPNTRKAALQAALQAVYASRACRVEALPKGAQGYTLTEVKGVTKNGVNTIEHNVRFSVEVPAALDRPMLKDPQTGSVVTPPMYEALCETYQAELGKVPHTKLSRSLKLAVQGMNGISLRTTGGVYWIPEKFVKSWAWLTRAVESSSPSSRVYRVRTALDPSGLKAIHDRLVSEIQQECEEIERDILNGSLGKRALNGRRNRADDMTRKVKMYEKILGQSLTGVRSTIKEADKTAAAAIVQLFGGV